MNTILNASIACTVTLAFALTGCATEQGDMQNSHTSTQAEYASTEGALAQSPVAVANSCSDECLRGWGRSIASCGGFGFNETTERCFRTSIQLVKSCVMDRCGEAEPAGRTVQCMTRCHDEGEFASSSCGESKSTEAQCIEEGQEVYLTCFDAECVRPVQPVVPVSPDTTTPEPEIPTFQTMDCHDVCSLESTSSFEECIEGGMLSSSTCASNARNLFSRCVSLTCQ